MAENSARSLGIMGRDMDATPLHAFAIFSMHAPDTYRGCGYSAACGNSDWPGVTRVKTTGSVVDLEALRPAARTTV